MKPDRQRRRHQRRLALEHQHDAVGPYRPARIAAAVQRVLAEELANDPENSFRACQMYARVGAVVLNVLADVPDRYHIQVGSLFLQPDPADPEFWVACVATEHGVVRGEFHCWIARVGRTPAETQFIDFDAFAYPTLTERLVDGASWRRSERPSYLWTTARDFPDWIRLEVIEEATLEEKEIAAKTDTALIRYLCARVLADLGWWTKPLPPRPLPTVSLVLA